MFPDRPDRQMFTVFGDAYVSEHHGASWITDASDDNRAKSTGLLQRLRSQFYLTSCPNPAQDSPAPAQS